MSDDARAVIRTWLERHDYPSDPSWQVANLLSDLRAAGFEARSPGHGDELLFRVEAYSDGFMKIGNDTDGVTVGQLDQVVRMLRDLADAVEAGRAIQFDEQWPPDA